MEPYIIAPQDFDTGRAYAEWKVLMPSLRNKMEIIAKLSAWRLSDYGMTFRMLHKVLASQDQGQVFLWKYDVWKAACSDADKVFVGTELGAEDLPQRMQYWSFDRDITVSEQSRQDLTLPQDFVVAGVLIVPNSVAVLSNKTEEQGVSVVVSYQPSGELAHKLLMDQQNGIAIPEEYRVPRFRVWPQQHALEHVRQEYAEYIACLRFMKLDFVEPKSIALPRSFRRREEKEGRIVPELRTILLRARKSEISEEATDAARREYACHFLVASHWRKPSSRMKEQRPVFVRPYVKGDTDKPFHAPTKTIYHVMR